MYVMYEKILATYFMPPFASLIGQRFEAIGAYPVNAHVVGQGGIQEEKEKTDYRCSRYRVVLENLTKKNPDNTDITGYSETLLILTLWEGTKSIITVRNPPLTVTLHLQ